jgi:hypothetical protein
VELELLTDPNSPDRDQIAAEAAEVQGARNLVLLRRIVQQRTARTERSKPAAGDAGQPGERSGNPPPRSSVATAPSRIRLQNRWTQGVTVVVDRVGYFVEAGAEVAISRPAGAFTYQVMAVQHFATTSRLNPGEIRTIRIGP